VFVLKTLIPVMAGLLILQGTSQLIRNGLVLTGHDMTPTRHEPEEGL
jgi:TRAP-type mannitol/chloroaromatic compound transport system permease small subunit